MTKGDRIRLVKPMGVFDNVGEICEVVDISEDGLISFRFGKCILGYMLGYMSYDEFEKYFEFVESETDLEEDNDTLDIGDGEDNEDLENKELKDVFEWCKRNDKPFLSRLYHSVVAKRSDFTKPVLGIYTNRLCLAQYKNKTFKDSDFSFAKINMCK